MVEPEDKIRAITTLNLYDSNGLETTNINDVKTLNIVVSIEYKMVDTFPIVCEEDIFEEKIIVSAINTDTDCFKRIIIDESDTNSVGYELIKFFNIIPENNKCNLKLSIHNPKYFSKFNFSDAFYNTLFSKFVSFEIESNDQEFECIIPDVSLTCDKFIIKYCTISMNKLILIKAVDYVEIDRCIIKSLTTDLSVYRQLTLSALVVLYSNNTLLSPIHTRFVYTAPENNMIIYSKSACKLSLINVKFEDDVKQETFESLFTINGFNSVLVFDIKISSGLPYYRIFNITKVNKINITSLEHSGINKYVPIIILSETMETYINKGIIEFARYPKDENAIFLSVSNLSPGASICINDTTINKVSFYKIQNTTLSDFKINNVKVSNAGKLQHGVDTNRIRRLSIIDTYFNNIGVLKLITEELTIIRSNFISIEEQSDTAHISVTTKLYIEGSKIDTAHINIICKNTEEEKGSLTLSKTVFKAINEININGEESNNTTLSFDLVEFKTNKLNLTSFYKFLASVFTTICNEVELFNTDITFTSFLLKSDLYHPNLTVKNTTFNATSLNYRNFTSPAIIELIDCKGSLTLDFYKANTEFKLNLTSSVLDISVKEDGSGVSITLKSDESLYSKVLYTSNLVKFKPVIKCLDFGSMFNIGTYDKELHGEEVLLYGKQ